MTPPFSDSVEETVTGRIRARFPPLPEPGLQLDPGLPASAAPVFAVVASPSTPASEGSAAEPPLDGDAAYIVGRPDALAPPLDALPNKSPDDPPENPPNDPADDPLDDPPNDPAEAPLVSPRLDLLPTPPCAQAARGAHTRASANDTDIRTGCMCCNRANLLATREDRACSSRLELIGPPAAADAAESGIRPRPAYGCVRPPADSTDTASHRSSDGCWSRPPRR